MFGTFTSLIVYSGPVRQFIFFFHFVAFLMQTASKISENVKFIFLVYKHVRICGTLGGLPSNSTVYLSCMCIDLVLTKSVYRMLVEAVVLCGSCSLCSFQ